MEANVNSASIRYWAKSDRPREKLLIHGKETLTNAELLAILLGSGSRNESALSLAQRILLKNDQNLIELGKMNLQELQKFNGMGKVKAITVIAALELGKRRHNSASLDRPKIVNSNDAYQLLLYDLSDLRTESFRILLLNRGNRVIKTVNISNGGIAGTVVDPKVIFKSAIDHEASSIILSHNHPSGNLKPSSEDIRITKKLRASGEILSIGVLDHLIISERGYFSFADESML